MRGMLLASLGLMFGCGSSADGPVGQAPGAGNGEELLVASGSEWRYLDDGSDQGTAWIDPSFDDSTWAVGAGEFGYGDGDEVTTVARGDKSDLGRVTTYFRHTFEVTLHPVRFEGLEVRLRRDDGAVVYLNGEEIVTQRLPKSGVTATTRALGDIGGFRETYDFPAFIRPDDLRLGTNVLAVEIHQATPMNEDLSFDLRLIGHREPSVIRGPYLQNMRSDGVVVRWRTITPTVGAVWVGATPVAQPNAQNTVFVESSASVDHEVELTGLEPGTTIYYGVGEAGAQGPRVGGDLSHRFVTAPLAGARQPFRAWLLGDSGTLSFEQQRVRDAYLQNDPTRNTDLMLFLGDNAYRQGLDEEYQTAFFEVYEESLKRTAMWTTRGNHESAKENYFATFTMPTAGEAGGVASTTEAYYSFDWANVHFVCLDSFRSDRSVGGAMYSWLELDLASTTQEWIIAFWHHPPYSKGSHNSDTEPILMEMRSNFVPMLEANGVALCLAGHSHSYERSYRIRGHDGISTTWDPAIHGVDLGDGRPEGDGAYEHVTATDQGAVYIVAGASGQLAGTGLLDHPAMFYSARTLGSVILDVAGDRLDVTYLDDQGQVEDRFAIVNPNGDGTICEGTVDGEGCVARMRTEGEPSLSSGQPFLVSATRLRAESLGILIYSYGATVRPGPFNGNLCLASGSERTGPVFSGGDEPCTGTLTFDFSTLWNDPDRPGLVPGATVFCQYWHRDQGEQPSTMTEALSFTILP